MLSLIPPLTDDSASASLVSGGVKGGDITPSPTPPFPIPKLETSLEKDEEAEGGGDGLSRAVRLPLLF